MTGARPVLRVVHPDDVVERALAQTLLERCRFPAAGSALACAVSGGADSLALLVLAVEAGLRPTAYHVDHGLRKGSDTEVEIVQAAGEVLEVPVVPVTVEIEAGANLEARARAARFAVLPSDVATGHTADDQAETVIINLLRGSATAGLSGMAAGPRHPILGLRREETRAVCREAGIEWFEDPSNAELQPLRNRIRHSVLPALNDLVGRDLVPILCRQAELLGSDEALLDELSRAIDPTSARQLSAAPLPLARRAVRRWLREAGTAGGLPPSAAAVDRVLAVAGGRALACDVGGGIAVRRRRGQLVIEKPGTRVIR